jgi:hypothetical protein
MPPVIAELIIQITVCSYHDLVSISIRLPEGEIYSIYDSSIDDGYGLPVFLMLKISSVLILTLCTMMTTMTNMT